MTKQKTFGFKEIKIPMGMFDYTIICIIGDYKNVPKYLANKYDDPISKWESILESSLKGCHPRGQCYNKSGYVPVIWLPRFPKTPREYSTVAHESIHAMFELLHWSNINNIKADNDEILCHGVGHIMNSVLTEGKK